MIVSKVITKYLLSKIKVYIKDDKINEVEQRIQASIDILLDNKKDNINIRK